MPMKMPFGSDGFQAIEWPIPTAMMTVPGFNSLATGLMKKTFANKGVASVSELRDTCVALGVRMIGCQMTMDVFGFEREEFIPEAEIAGAAAFLEFAADADVTLFV
jgi:peroxiredoxin family protein